MGSISSITPLDGIERDIRASGIPYGRCDSTSTSTAFTATVPGVTSLHDGVCVLLKNGVVTSEEGFTINVNGLGAKPVYSSMAAATRVSTVFNVSYTMLLVYDETRVSGGCWVVYYGYYTSTNSIGYQVRTNSTVRNTTDAFRYHKILFSSPDNSKWVPAASSTKNSASSAKTVNQRPINPFGEIVYCSASTSYAENAAVSATAVWQQNTLALGYSFNRTGAALTLATKKPVYVKCAPQSDGSAIIDADTPYVQDLPSAADDKIYIWLGIAYSATQIELTVKHPVFYHDGTGIRIWTGKTIPTKTSDLANDSGFVAPSETPSAGQVLMYNNGAWEPMWQEKSLQLPYQLIPLSFDGTSVSTTITPRDIAEGYTFDGVDYPPYLRSSLTKADLFGSTILLTPVYGNTDGYEFQSGIFDLTSFGFTGLNGLLHIETRNGYSSPYQCTLVTWPASYPTPADIGAIPDPGGSSNGQVLAYSNGTWAADDLNTMLNNEDARQIFITVNNGVYHIDADIATIAGANLSCRKVLFMGVDNGIVMVFEPVEIDQNTGMMVLASIGGVYNYQRLTFYPNLVDGGMDGTLELIPTGADKITTPESSQSGDVLTFNGTKWVASAPVKELPTVSASDNGKILRVVNGTWDAVTVPNANGVSF